ncbi:MAG: HNH endonuclease signature motif containing protein [Geitlerinemataceae cyanobacterium]
MNSKSIPNALRKFVFERAAGRYEYCLIHQKASMYSHEIDHIIPQKHGGRTEANNLALSCLSCNRYKGSDFATIDPKTEDIIPLFNPRKQIWSEKFSLNEARIEGRTQIGIATVRLLRLNALKRLIEREVLLKQKRYP